MNDSQSRSFSLNNNTSSIPRSEHQEDAASPLSSFLLRLIFAITAFSCIMLMKNSSDTKVRAIYEAIGEWAECSYSVPEEYGIEKFVSIFKEDAESVSGDTNVPPLLFPSNGKVTVHFGEDNCKGIIISSEQDEFIFPSADGAIKEISENDILGKYIVIDCNDGIEITYGLCNNTGVAISDEVDTNTVLASMTKGSDGQYHIYMEVSVNNVPVDPELCFTAASV